MGYSISYEKCGRAIKVSRKQPKSKNKFSPTLVILLIVLALFFLAQNQDARLMMLPGNGAVTASALEDFVATVQKGEGICEAVTTFCKEIIDNAS